MGTAVFRFYAELTDLLGPDADSGRVVRSFDEAPSVKDQIEACGVPHTEVDLILANGESVDFGYRLCHGDRISVYPVFESFDIQAVSRVRPEPLREMRFVVDVNLGKLARYLRLLGLDTAANGDDVELVQISVAEHRILLTKDRPLLKRSAVTHGYLVRSDDPAEQMAEVVRRFDLGRLIDPFTRCMYCNAEVEDVEKAEVDHLLEPLTRRYFDRFRQCSGCERVFWRGSHFERLEAIVEAARAQAGYAAPR